MSNRKSEILGEVFSSARQRLSRMILFQLIIETNKNVCFRCGKEIEKIEDLSIEHKISWMSAKNPKEMFYDLNNIAFSHFLCNSGASNTGNPRPTVQGEKNKSAKLTAVQVGEIREKLSKGFSFTELGREYNVSETSIRKIKTRKNWKYT